MTRILFLILALSLFAAAPARADFDAGKRAYDKKDWAEAIRELRPLAEQGDDRALLLLGHMYNDGRGVIKDRAEALELYHKAAQADNTNSMVVIAAMHQAGLGVPKNPSLAQQWFQYAAEMGNQPAAFFNGIALFRGDTGGGALKQDLQASYKWLLVAARDKTYPKVAKAAEETARAISGRLKGSEIDAARKAAESFAPLPSGKMPPLPPLKQEADRAPDKKAP
jgi:TPR repeat protein